MGEKKVVLFALIPDNDTSFNFLVSILYTQLFQQLFYLADKKYGGNLPVPVHFLMDEFLYLGGNEQSTHKYVSELLGKETIDMNTYGQSKGHSGSYSTNWQITGRELLDAAEVRMLDNRYALLLIRGERPILDEKYDILKHPNVALSVDGRAKPYEHGKTDHATASILFAGNSSDDFPEIETEQTDYELLSDEDVEVLFL